MSRAEKQRRRQHRREKKHRDRSLSMQRWGDSDRLSLLSYDVTYEKLDVVGETLDLSDEERAALFDLVHKDPVNAVERIKLHLDRHPRSPILLNWLYTAYHAAKDEVNAELTAKLNYEANPGYLFAKLNYATTFLSRGELAEADEILGGKYELKLMYPDRDVFHVTEVVSFYGIMVQYFLRKKKPEVAERYCGALQDLAPEHPITRQCQQFMKGSLLLQLARKLSRSFLRTGELP